MTGPVDIPDPFVHVKMELPDGTLMPYYTWAGQASENLLLKNVSHFLASINKAFDGYYSNSSLEMVKQYHLALLLLVEPGALEPRIKDGAMAGIDIKTGGKTGDYNKWAMGVGMDRLKNDVKSMIGILNDRSKEMHKQDLARLHGGLMAMCMDISKPIKIKN